MRVVRRKFPTKLETVDLFLSQLPFELVYTPAHPRPGLIEIRDKMDYPILYSAITEDIDVLITGDRDFEELSLERPTIVSPALFLEKY